MNTSRVPPLAAEFRWPPKPTFTIYNGRGKALSVEKDPRLDLADTLMLHWPHRMRIAYVGIKSGGARWQCWTEERLAHVENLMKYDLTFDGYDVSISRNSPQLQQPCAEEFRWILKIREK